MKQSCIQPLISWFSWPHACMSRQLADHRSLIMLHDGSLATEQEKDCRNYSFRIPYVLNAVPYACNPPRPVIHICDFTIPYGYIKKEEENPKETADASWQPKGRWQSSSGASAAGSRNLHVTGPRGRSSRRKQLEMLGTRRMDLPSTTKTILFCRFPMIPICSCRIGIYKNNSCGDQRYTILLTLC